MKERIIILLLCFSCYFKAQIPFNKAYHDRWENTYPFLKEIMGDYYFFNCVIDGTGYYGSDFLYKHSSTGKLIYKKLIFSTTQYREIVSCIKTLDNKLLLIGHRNFCDVVDSSLKSFITKIDTGGIQMFDLSYKTAWMQNNNFIMDNFKNVLQHADSSYFVFSDSVMYHFSKTGSYLSKTTGLGITNISSAAPLINSNILISGRISGTPKLIEINTGGSIITQSTTADLFTKLSFLSDQNILSLANGKLYKISPSYSVIANSILPSSEAMSNYDLNNDTVYAVSQNSVTQVPAYRILDGSLNSLSQSTTSTQRVNQLAITYKNGNVGVLSDCRSHATFLADNSYSSLNVFPKGQSNNFLKDVAVLRIETDSCYAACSTNTILNATFCTVNLRANVWVRNLGQNTVNGIKLNCYLKQNVACGAQYYQKQFAGLGLLPGDSVKLLTGWMSKYDMVSPNAASFSFCIYSTLPDSTNDKLISNDGKCHTISFSPASLKENAGQNLLVKVYPVPAGDQLSVEGLHQLNELEFYDISGRLVKTVVKPENQKPIPITDLNPGLYLLRIETESGTVQRKFIKN